MTYSKEMDNDELERLLREIDATSGSQPRTPTPVDRKNNDVEKPGSSGGRVGFAALSAGFLGAGGFLVGLFMPVIGSISTGVGAAGGAFVVALIAGPPKWFSH